MKKSILLFNLFFILNITSPELNVSQSLSTQPAKGFVITLTAANSGQGYVYLSRRINGIWKNLDSAMNKTMPVILKGRLEAPELLYLRSSGSGTLVPFFGENSNIIAYADFNDPSKSTVSGSTIHNEYQVYYAGFLKTGANRQQLMAEYKKAQQSGDQQELANIVSRINAIDAGQSEYNINYVKSNPASFLSPYLIRNVMFYTLDFDELKSLVGSLSPSLKNSLYLTELKDKIAIQEKVSVGKEFTDIILPDPMGQIMKLSAFTGGKVVLIDFWASWCGPCRGENPNVVKLYNDYHTKGFDIVGVSLDTEKSKWLEAIKNDGLAWHHMSDLKGWGSAGAGLYGVSSIPHTVLIGKDGRIIAKNLRGEELRAKVGELVR